MSDPPIGSFFSRLTSKLSSYDSPVARLWLTAFASSGLTVAAVFIGQAARRTALRAQLRQDVESHWKRKRRRRRRSSIVEENDQDDDEEGWTIEEGENGELELDEHGLPKHLPRQPRGPKADRPSEGAKERRKPDESLIAEQLTRNIAFLGEDGNRQVREAFVIVVGLGGVGSSCATMLARSGVGKIRLIDFDQVSLSSLNVRVIPSSPLHFV